MRIGIPLLFLLVTGCMTNQQYADATRAQPVALQIHEHVSPIKPETEILGRTYHFSDSEVTASLDAPTLEKVRNIVRRKMTELGYEEVKSLRKAYVSIHIIGDWDKLADDGVTSVKTTTTRMENGKIVSQFSSDAKQIARVTIGIATNIYAKRPVEIGNLFYASPTAEWKGFEDQLLASIERDFSKTVKAAPSKNKKMAGDPGCMLRFGYNTDRMTDKVTQVQKKSPAERAGLRVGDQILAIDSTPAADTYSNRKVYEDRVTVPVKFKRGDQVLRSEMKPALMCE